MPLAGGSHIGPYEIISLLGAGGMGEVYRARDSRLNRDVALKVIHPDAADSASLRARFATEARAVAALNHPNIVAIFDIGEEQGVQYTVSELIEGESLRSLLRNGAIPVRKLIDIAVQIADGLAAAHAAQITHRDLKPENIMLATDGRVKILDFGLARQSAPVAAAASGEHATLTIQTKTGTILGTPNYMSPEQARGIPADYRSDQFSFGLILYEMATGKKAFDQPSMVETLSAIVREEPAPIEVRLPPPLRWAMDRCLAKDPQQRYDSTRDLFHDLRALRDHLSETLSGVSTEGVVATPHKASPRRALHLWIEAALILALGVAVFVAFRLSRGDDISQYRYTPFAMNSDAQPSNPVWSHDGKAIAWNETVDGHRQVFVRYLNSPVPSQLTHQATSATLAGWSQDSRRVLFSAQGPSSRAKDETNAIYSIAIVGGEPEYLAALPNFDINYDLSPDGRTLAVFGRKEGGKYQLWISSPLGSPFREYAPAPFASTALYNSHDLAFSPDGKKILLIRTGDSDSEEAWLAPFPSGTPRRVFTGLPTKRLLGRFSWMPDGRHVAMSLGRMDPSNRTHLWMLDTESNDARQITNGVNDQYSVAASPDGRRLAYSENKRDFDIVNVTLKDGATSQLIATDVSERMPAWSLRSPKLVYATDRSGTMEIWLRASDGQERPLVTPQTFSDGGTRFFMNPALSPNGETVLFLRENELGEDRSWVMPVASGVPQRLNESANDTEYAADWSADGTRVVENTVVGDGVNLAIVKVGSREKPLILREHVYNVLPAWSPNGEWIVFRDKAGWNLISPDGKTVKPLGKIATSYLMFSRDSKLLYGIRSDGAKRILFSLDVATKAVHDIRDLGKEFTPASDYGPAIRYTLTPDGESMTYAVSTYKSDLWLLEGFRPSGGFARLFR